MSELKPCPFCGKEDQVVGSTDRMSLGWWYACEDCFENRKGGVHEEHWNTRPIEDALNTRIAELEYQLEDWTNNGWAEDYKARIAELEAENIRLGIEYQRMRLALGDIAINSKRALKESPTDQPTARLCQERQDDKWIPEVQE